MITIKAKIDQDRIQKKINKTIEEYELDESKVKLVFDYDTMIIDILYNENTLIDIINVTNYMHIDFGWA